MFAPYAGYGRTDEGLYRQGCTDKVVRTRLDGQVCTVMAMKTEG